MAKINETNPFLRDVHDDSLWLSDVPLLNRAVVTREDIVNTGNMSASAVEALPVLEKMIKGESDDLGI